VVRIALLLVSLLAPGLARAQAPAPERPPLLLIFDASGSMNQRMGNETRLVAAKRVVSDLLASFPEGTRLGLTLYGHRRARDCSDIENVQPIAPIDRQGLFRMATQIGGLTARGETPIARTLIESIPVFRGQGGSIVLVTDGREECGGDVCAAARQLAAAGVSLRVDIVGFGTGAAERRALQCVTDITGGRYLEAPDAARLRDALATVTQPQAPAAPPPQQTRLRVTVTENGRAPAGQPSIRVRGGNFDQTLSDRTVTFTLPPGDYQVTARLGSGQESEVVPVTVVEGRTAELAVGIGTGRIELRLLLGQGRAFPGHPNIELRRDGRVVAATSGAQAAFDADPGQYTLRVMMPGGQQWVDVPDLRITAGQTSRYSVEAGAGELTVNVGGRFRPGAQPFPMVQVLQGGRLVMALTDNPARFVITPGSYEIAVFEGGSEVARRPLTVAAGDSQTMELAP
jgi:hypothetical protein